MKFIIIVIAMLSLILTGCSERGWPGIASGNTSEGEALIAGTMDGYIRAINPENTFEMWEWKPESDGGSTLLDCVKCSSGGQFRAGSIYGPPSVANGTVFVGSYTGDVYALNIENGNERWGREMDTEIVGGITVYGDTIYFGSSDGKLHALDAEDGTNRAGFPFIADDKIWSAPAVKDGVLYFGTLDHKLYAVDAVTGEPKWSEPFEAKGGIGSTPLIIDGVLYFGSYDSNFYAVYADTGALKWVFDDANDWYWSNAAYKDGVIYTCSMDSHVYALNAESGTPVWSTPFEADHPIKASPVVYNDVLVVASENGKVYGIDLPTGSNKWPDIDVGSKVLAPLYEKGGRIYINTQNNKLYAYDGDTGIKKWDESLKD